MCRLNIAGMEQVAFGPVPIRMVVKIIWSAGSVHEMYEKLKLVSSIPNLMTTHVRSCYNSISLKWLKRSYDKKNLK